jgi:hypothetical protein
LASTPPGKVVAARSTPNDIRVIQPAKQSRRGALDVT